MSGWDADFTEWLNARTPALLRYAFMLTADRDVAADLLQDVLIKVGARWNHVKTVEPEAYVRRALTNQAISQSKRRRRETSLDGVAEPASPDPTTSVDKAIAVQRALAALPPRQRATIVLRYFEDYSEMMIAQALDCSVGTVKSQLHKASVALRASLTDQRLN
jgi:RNA polymerase sigma-70 factor (sigma-E family)